MSAIPRYISPRGLAHLAAHKYRAGEYSHLDLIVNRWWLAASEAMPLWLAPNLITLIGTLAVVAASAVAEAYKVPCLLPSGLSGGAALPPWVHAYMVATIFFYQTMDAVDGKQARRTGSSSPLGQLFDHGCDALVTALQARNLALAFGLGSHWLGDWALVGGCTVFFAGQWEEYFTRVLRTAPNRWLGVTEIQFIAMGVHAAAAALPCGWWHAPATLRVPAAAAALAAALPAPLAALVPPAHAALATLPVNEWVAYGLLASMAWGLGSFLVNVLVVWRHADGWAGRATAAAYLLPTAVMGGVTLWLTHPAGQTATQSLGAAHVGGGALLLAYCAGQTHATNQMIVYSMCRDPFPVGAQAGLYAFPALAAVAAAYPLPLSLRALHGLVGMAIALYLAFVAGAMRQITTHLGIRAFVITPKLAPQQQPPAAAAAAAAAASPAPAARRRSSGASHRPFIASPLDDDEGGSGSADSGSAPAAAAYTAQPAPAAAAVSSSSSAAAAPAPRRRAPAGAASRSRSRSAAKAAPASAAKPKRAASRSGSSKR